MARQDDPPGEEVAACRASTSRSRGLSDLDELTVYGTDAMNDDTDGDGLTDRDEILLHGTNPLEIDTDGDGYSDPVELAAGSDPLATHPFSPAPAVP